jgi:5,5'-dehydrodivanillate O-demethylase oxygenase subunit
VRPRPTAAGRSVTLTATPTVERSSKLDLQEFAYTGPGTLAGRYLRRFWHPIYHAADLPAGQAKPVRVMSEDFTLYRGESGAVHLLDFRCAHRGTQLSTGWVEGDCLRCFYHGWKYDASGQCVEMPAEDPSFPPKVRIGSYPVREYLGLIFAYLGEGEAPEFPRYPDFESFDGVVEIDSYLRRCNYFQNLENALDMSHVGFVHADNEASFEGIGSGHTLRADESPWGVAYTATRPSGEIRINQFGMPNMFHMNALPTDVEVGWQESLFWWTPIDDTTHVQFSLHRLPITGELAERICARRQARRDLLSISHQDACEQILAGTLRLWDLDTTRVDLVRLQDDIAQLGQGHLVDRTQERLGRGDVGMIAIRKLWQRELRALAEGRPLTRWTRPPEVRPTAWLLPGKSAEESGGTNRAVRPGTPTILDVRPYAEVREQARAYG